MRVGTVYMSVALHEITSCESCLATASRKLLVLSARELPHQKHTTSFAALALGACSIADGGLGARVAGRARPRTVVHLRRTGRQLARRAETATSKLPHERGVGAAYPRELASERSGTSELRCDAVDRALAPGV